MLGNIVFELFPDSAPNHVRNFKYLVNSQFYTSTTIHRVVENFVIQGGDPTGTGAGGTDWTLNEEFNGILHERGILSMARGPNANSASSQYFVCHADAPHLNYQYTVFGRVLQGMDVVDSVATSPVNGSRPLHTIRIASASVVSRTSF